MATERLHSRWQTPISVSCLALLLFSIGLTSACGSGDTNLPQPIRTPRPTFTPKSQVAPSTNNAEVSEPEVLVRPADDAQETQPAQSAGVASSINQARPESSVVGEINFSLVNVREGPGTDFEVVEIVEEGQQFDVFARNEAGDWWQICCIDDEPVWVIDDYLDILGGAETVPVFGAQSRSSRSTQGNAAASNVVATIPTSTPVPTQAPTATPAPATRAPATAYALIGSEQFEEDEVVRIYLYIHDVDEEVGLANHTLQVFKDGEELPVRARSLGGPPGFTWPFFESRQQPQNMKIEYGNQSPGGVWTVQLVDSDGQVVGPKAQFALDDDEQNRELYVDYARR